MAEPVALHVLVCDLHDELGAQRHEREVLAGVPPTHGPRHPGRPLCLLVGPFAPRMLRQVVRDERLELGDEARPSGHRERRGDADVMQATVVVVESEEQRTHDPAALVPAEARDDAVGRALVLDLEHRPLVGLVRAVERLGDDTVEARALEAGEPVVRHGDVRRGRSDEHGIGGIRQRLDEPTPPLGEGLRHQVVVADGEQVEPDERGGRALCEHAHAAVGWVDALLEGVEVEAAVDREDDLPVDDAARRQVLPQRLDELGEVPRHRALVAAAEFDLVPVLEDDGAEAVPFRFDVAHVWDLADGFREHRSEGRHHREVHPSILLRDGRLRSLDVRSGSRTDEVGPVAPAHGAVNPLHPAACARVASISVDLDAVDRASEECTP